MHIHIDRQTDRHRHTQESVCTHIKINIFFIRKSSLRATEELLLRPLCRVEFLRYLLVASPHSHYTKRTC